MLEWRVSNHSQALTQGLTTKPLLHRLSHSHFRFFFQAGFMDFERAMLKVVLELCVIMTLLTQR